MGVEARVPKPLGCQLGPQTSAQVELGHENEPKKEWTLTSSKETP